MRSVWKLCGVLCCLILMAGCNQGSEAGVTRISAKEAKEKMDQGGVVVLDVRTPEEYAQSHIDQAMNIPLDELAEIQKKVETTETILVYCRSGNRSAQAAKGLLEFGYEHVFDFGGIMDWPYDVVTK